MKKIIITTMALLLASSLSAATLDVKNAKVGFVAYKLKSHAAVKAGFSKVRLHFSKGEIGAALDGATALIDIKSIDAKNEEKNKNIYEGFFKHFKGGEIKVAFSDVIYGEDSGVLIATITMNKKTQKVPMSIEVKDGVLHVGGLIDVRTFALGGALSALEKACSSYHKGYTWPQVLIGLEVPVK